MERRRIDCVGGIVTGPDDRLLMIRRGTEPSRGCWSVPGGRVEVGESDEQATVREVLEETGVAVTVHRLAGTVEIDAPDGSVYVVRDYVCAPAPGTAADPRAGDDADEAEWFTPAQVRALTCSPGLLSSLESWGLL